MLEPMGLPKDVSVIAWGISLERPTMIYYGINSIRELFGCRRDFTHTRDAQISMFIDKNEAESLESGAPASSGSHIPKVIKSDP